MAAPRCPDACPHVPVAHAKAAADRLALGGIADQRPTWLTLSAALQLLRSDKTDVSPVLLEMLLTLKPIRCVRCCLCKGARAAELLPCSGRCTRLHAAPAALICCVLQEAQPRLKKAILEYVILQGSPFSP